MSHDAPGPPASQPVTGGKLNLAGHELEGISIAGQVMQLACTL